MLYLYTYILTIKNIYIYILYIYIDNGHEYDENKFVHPDGSRYIYKQNLGWQMPLVN